MWPFSKKQSIKRAGKIAVAIAAGIMALSSCNDNLSNKNTQDAKNTQTVTNSSQKNKELKTADFEVESKKVKNINPNANPYSNPENIPNTSLAFGFMDDLADIQDETKKEIILSLAFESVIKNLNSLSGLKKEIKKKYGGYQNFFIKHYNFQYKHPNDLPSKQHFSVTYIAENSTIQKSLLFMFNNDIVKSEFPFSKKISGSYDNSLSISRENGIFNSGSFFLEHCLPYGKSNGLALIKCHLFFNDNPKERISFLSDTETKIFTLLNDDESSSKKNINEIRYFQTVAEAEKTAEKLVEKFKKLGIEVSFTISQGDLDTEIYVIRMAKSRVELMKDYKKKIVYVISEDGGFRVIR